MLIYKSEEEEQREQDELLGSYIIDDYKSSEKEKKKKKKKKKSNDWSYKDDEEGLLDRIDKNIYSQYTDMVNNIKEIQYRIDEADKKFINRNKEKALRNNDYCVPPVMERLEIRKKATEELESRGIIDTVIQIIKDLIPIARIIARLLASLIVAILSIDRVKLFIKPSTMEKMDKVMNFAMSV